MLSEQIKGLHDQREAKVNEFEALVKKAEDENRISSQEENDTMDTLASDITDLDDRIKRLEQAEQMHAKQFAKPLMQETSPAVQIDKRTDDPSLFYAKLAHCLYVCGGDRMAAFEYAKTTWGNEGFAAVLKMPTRIMEKAAQNPGTSTTVGWAAELVQVNQASSAFIDALRPMSVVARFPGMQMSFEGNGSIKIPRLATPSGGTWVGENKAIKVDSLGFDDVTLVPLKNANIVTATNELLMRSDPSALSVIRDDIVRGVAISIDTKFTSDDAAAAGVSPAGLQTFDTAKDTSSGSSLDNITSDLRKLVDAMLTVNMPMTRPTWLMHPVNVNFLRFIRDGLGTYAFRTEIAGGTIFGYPYMESTSVPLSEIILVDASQVIIAQEMAPVISLSEDASLHMEDTSPADDIGGATTPVASLFQRDLTGIRCKTTIDWNVRHAGSVQVLTTVAWS